MSKKRAYSQSNFANLIESGYVYVDKPTILREYEIDD